MNSEKYAHNLPSRKMETEMKLITMILLTLILLTGVDLLAQDSMRVLESQFMEIDSVVSELKNKKEVLKEQLQEKTVQVQELKSESTFNYFQRQKLEELLKDSQDFSNRIADLDTKIHTENNGFVVTGNRLLNAYDFEIAKSLKNLETKELSQEYRKTILQNIENLRRKKGNVKKRTEQRESIEIRMSELQIGPDDTPKRIKQKADLLKDQEDKFRRLAGQLNSQKEELTKELNLRNRIDDMVTDLALFDQQEEVLGNLSTAEDGNRLASAEDLNPDEANLGVRASETNLIFVGQKDFDFSTLSPDQLEEIIENITAKERQAEVKADSLGKQAEVFYKTAKQQKKQ